MEEESKMNMVMETFDKVRKVVCGWMTPIWKEWDEDRLSWSYSTDADKFQWECFNHFTNDGIEIGGEFPCHNCIEIWTGKRTNVSIFIGERGIVFNEDQFITGFSRNAMHNLYELLVDAFKDTTEEEAEEVMNNNLEEESKDTGIKIDDYRLQLGVVTKTKFDLNFFELYKAYAIYDRADACRHGILTSANENDLAFCTYGTGALRTDILIDIDEYLDGEYKIIPLIDNEQ